MRSTDVVLRIIEADLDGDELRAFLQAHLDDIAPTAPPESRHALDLDGLRAPGVRVWEARDAGRLAGTVALAPLDGTAEELAEELKSMRTEPALRGRGIASALLGHALADARSRGVQRVLLETGSMEFFVAARTLYAKAGFVPRGPFGTYVEDPNSVFMELDVGARPPG